MLLDRRKPLDLILRTAERKGLKRSLGPFQLTMLGIGGVIGTGIFVLTAEAAQLAGPAMALSFVLAAVVCGVAALCYAELSAMVPVSGSAYTYTYAVMGELLAWIVGWALVLEYAVAASAVAVGWSGYIVGVFDSLLGITIPASLANGPSAGGIVNLPAIAIVALVTLLLVRGTKESASVNAVLVAVKLVTLAMFIALAFPAMHAQNFHPFAPLGATGVTAAAASIFFAFVGFDAVSTAAEETRDPQRNVPIGLIASLAICTVLYLLVAAGVTGAFGSQPVTDAAGGHLEPGSGELARRCASLAVASAEPLVCSKEALAHVLKQIGHPAFGNLLGLAVGFALPSVILTMMFGQSRLFFVMARDGLLPRTFARVHPRFETPHVITMITGVGVAVAAAFFPVGRLAAISNTGTLCAFLFVAVAVLMLRRSQPDRHRPFRTPAVWLVAPLAAVGCVGLFAFLPPAAKIVFPVWTAIGLAIYFGYSRSRSDVGRGVVGHQEGDPASADAGGRGRPEELV